MSSIVKGSILDMAAGGNGAVALMKARIAIVSDTSDSMRERTRNKKSKFLVQQEILTELQSKYPGQVAVVSFNESAKICLDGNLPLPDKGTNMMEAFRVIESLAEIGIKVVFTSDGEPTNDPEFSLLHYAANNLVGDMDVIYVGDPKGRGEKFMIDLARAVKGEFGSYSFNDDPKFLTEKLEQLLISAGE